MPASKLPLYDLLLALLMQHPDGLSAAACRTALAPAQVPYQTIYAQLCQLRRTGAVVTERPGYFRLARPSRGPTTDRAPACPTP